MKTKTILVLLLASLALVASPRAVDESTAGPAARSGDFQQCPLVTAGVPHVGGVVIGTASTVVICGSPAATLGDPAQCNGPDTVVASGSSTVLIGGRPAARSGDVTTHGGVIVGGCGSVVIGN